MRYLRMLTNAIAGGVLGATYLAVLVLQLNPQVPIVSITAARWFITLIAFYGLYLSVAVYLLILGREVLASRPLRPAWFSVRLAGWVGAAYAVGAAVVTWRNLRGFLSVLDASAVERMRQGAVATTVFAVILVLIVLLRYSFGRQGNRTTAALLLASMILSVIVPLWLRGPGDLPVPPARPIAAPTHVASPPPRVHLLLLDGADLDFIRPRVAAGQLPNFGRIIERGAAMNLATLKPTQAEPVWAAAATGKYPPKGGVRSNAIYRVRPDDGDPVNLLPDYCFAAALYYQSFITEEPVTSLSLHARTLWDILADYGVVSGIVNWPMTHPVRPSPGYVVSDYFDEAASSPLRLADAQAAYPTSAVDIAREVFDQLQSKPWHEVLPSFGPNEPPPSGFLQARWDPAYSQAVDALEQEFATRLTAVRYEGLDIFGHNYLRDAQPELFGEPSREEASRSVLDRYYAYIDGEIGRAMGRLQGEDLLLVVSGFGMKQEAVSKRLLARLLDWPVRSGSHESAPDGFLLAYGANVAHGVIPRGSIVDLTPTVLYYMGLPVGRDMDGFARTDLFARAYTVEHSVSYIGTHEK
jgi:predicted AlkP superfamily phosphohydrolase/phosphomutase